MTDLVTCNTADSALTSRVRRSTGEAITNGELCQILNAIAEENQTLEDAIANSGMEIGICSRCETAIVFPDEDPGTCVKCD